MTTDPSSPADRSFQLTRTYNAAVGRVWAAWTQKDQIDRWWGPDGFVTTTEHMDVRVGGEWRYLMVHAQYGSFDNRARYREVVPGARLVYRVDDGNDDYPGAFTSTVTFEEVEGGTRVTLTGVMDTAAALDQAKKFGAIEMGEQNLRRLDALLAD